MYAIALHLLHATISIFRFLGYLTYDNAVSAPITLNLPHDDVGVFTNVCLLLHVIVAYCINSTVLTRAICDSIWPGMLGNTLRHNRIALRWGMISTSILIFCGVVALLVPFFSDLMNVWSSIGIFTLSFAVPSLLYIIDNRGDLSNFAIAVNIIIIALAIVGCCLGVWAAGADIADKWAHCDMSLKF